MRSILTQGHAQNVRDFILNFGLDSSDKTVLDFTYGKGGLWEIEYPYKCKLVKCDAVPPEDEPDVHKKDLTVDDYSEFAPIDAAFFDPPYLYGREGTDNNSKQKNGKNEIVPASQQGSKSWAADGHLGRYMTNESEQVFVERVKGVNRAALQCMKKGGLLFVKVQDTRDGLLIPNQIMTVLNLTNFGYYWCAPYVKSGGQTWKHLCETSHGFWLSFKLLKDGKQEALQ